MGFYIIGERVGEVAVASRGTHTFPSGLTGDYFLWEITYPNRGREVLRSTNPTLVENLQQIGRYEILASNGDRCVCFEIDVV